MDIYLAIKTKIIKIQLKITIMIIDYQIKLFNKLISLLADLNSINNLLLKTLNIIFKTIFI